MGEMADKFDQMIQAKLEAEPQCHFCGNPSVAVRLIDTPAESGDPMDNLIQIVTVCDSH